MANPKESHAATEALEKECIFFLQKTINVNSQLLNLNNGSRKTSTESSFSLKLYESEIVNFYRLLLQNELSTHEVTRINNFIASVRNAALSAKDLKDIKHNIEELSNSATDIFYEFYSKIRENQKQFYFELNELINHLLISSSSDLELLNKVHQGFYQEEMKNLYQLFSQKNESEINMPSLLNMTREINNSNEALLRAVQFLIVKE